jgi:putative inorganic carbon (HCO3(-)) transporter
MIFLGLSCYNAIDQHKAIYGESGRNEGLLMLLCYYLLFYAARLITSEKIRRLTINTFILFMFCHAVYGITQHWGVKDSIVPVIDHYFYAISGVAGNPNFMGSLMVMATAVSMGMCIFSENIFIKGIYGLLTGLFAFVLAYTKTMSGFVGVAMVMLTVFLLLLQAVYRKKGRKTAVLFASGSILLAILAVIVIDKATYGIVLAEIKGVINQLTGDIN